LTDLKIFARLDTVIIILYEVKYDNLAKKYLNAFSPLMGEERGEGDNY